MRAPEKIWLAGPAGNLEAVARFADEPIATAVLAHPHPRFGGTMHNPVIFYADRELSRLGVTTVRFNFRGVGGSEGTYDEGNGEVQDVGAAVDWLRLVQPGRPLILVGYSFGSLCSIRYAASAENVAGLIAIGLPVRLYELPELAQLEPPLMVVQGSEDQFGSPAAVRAALVAKPPPVKLSVLPGAEHLFHGRSREAGDLVAEVGRELLELIGVELPD